MSVFTAVQHSFGVLGVILGITAFGVVVTGHIECSRVVGFIGHDRACQTGCHRSGGIVGPDNGSEAFGDSTQPVCVRLVGLVTGGVLLLYALLVEDGV
ncbi:MAG: hypothetical protein BWY72_01461 [Bacteroidetes bacterium ADurb.Bin416]|nr:MAG: hypothetical protein BWY72_01461 [Bacteroidetes bacterium ADurb.Bin416]